MTYDPINDKHRKRNQEYQRRWYRANKAKQIERTTVQKTKNRQRNRELAMERLKDGCIDCGETEFCVLEFDHVRGKKVENISTMINLPTGLERLSTELEKCEVVCANCHRRRTANRVGWWSVL